MSEDGFSDSFDEPNMEIQIDTLMGTSFDMRVSSTDTIREIKQRIQRVEGIPIHQQNLIYQSKELKDSRRLCDAGIKNGSTIKLVVSMKGGPISTGRLRISCEHHLMHKELKELLENTIRDEIGDKLAPGSKVSVLVFKEGDILNLLRVIENEDGSYSPYSEKPISPPAKPRRESQMAMFEKLVEDTDMMTKISNLRKKMEDVSLKRQQKGPKSGPSKASDDFIGDEIDEDSGFMEPRLSLSPAAPSSSSAAYSNFKFLTSTDILDNVDLNICENSTTPAIAAAAGASSLTQEEEAEAEEVALKDKHRIKKKSIYSETKGALSHTKQNYARIHKKAREKGAAAAAAAATTETDPEPVQDPEVCLPLTVPKHNTVHLTRLVLSEGVERPKSTPDSIELEENAQELWEIHEPASERLKHSATCKFGVLKRRQSLDYGYEGLENASKQQEIGEYNYGEVCSGNLFVPQFVTSPSAIPPQYSPKDQELCDYYFTNNSRSPLYGRKSKSSSTAGGCGGETASGTSSETLLPSEDLAKSVKNMSECSSTIQRLKNDCSGGDDVAVPHTDSILGNPTSLMMGDGLFSLPPISTRPSATGKTEENLEDLYGYYNWGCASDLLGVKSKRKECGAPTLLPPVIKKKSRCNECNKRLNITNIYNCRCGKIFCSQHRYSEVHRCSYDYKTEGRRILECQNPLVTAEKISRI